MDGIIEAFGLDLRLIIIQVLNFGIMLGLLSYFLYKPVMNLLKEREDKIASGLKDAEEAKVAKESATTEKQSILASAHGEAGEIVERAKASAKHEEVRILSEAEGKAGTIVSEAAKKGEQLKAEMLSESEKQIAQLAILATEKLLKEKTN